MLPGRPRIQPSNEPIVPVSSNGAACGAARRASICRGWLGADDLKRAVRHLEHDRRPAGALGDGQHRIAHLDGVDPGEGRIGLQPSERFSPGCGPDPSGGGSISRLVSPASLRSTRMSAPSSTHAADPGLAQEQREGIEIHRDACAPARARAAMPQAALVSVTPSATSAGSRLMLHRQRHARGELAAGDLADLLGETGLVARQVAGAEPQDRARCRERHER